MESFFGDNEESTEDITKRKSSKIKSLKTRFFRKSKKTGAEADAKLSQSTSDITAGKVLGSDEDLASQGAMGSRAFSHDSIFLDDQVLSDPDPVRVLSQENVHSKIKSLQIKLQLEKRHFGPPPMVLPTRSPENTAHQSEDFPFHNSNETSEEGTLTKTTSQPTTPPVSPISRLSQTRSQPQIHFSPLGSNYPSTSTVEAPVDFSTPAKFSTSLDTSAARHRMSIKPRNQRALAKKKPSSGTQPASPICDLKTPECFELVQEQEMEVVPQEGEVEERDNANLSQLSPLKFEEVSPVLPEVAPKLPTQSFTQQDKALPETDAFPVPRVKPPRRLDTSSSKRPHSSYIESEIKEKKEANLESQVASQNKRNTFNVSMTEVSSDQLSPFSSFLASKAFSAQQQPLQRDEDTATRIKRQSPRSGSFHGSRNCEEERPRSGSFTGVPQNPEAKTKTFGGTEEKITREKEEQKCLQPKGSPFAAERPSSSSLPWERNFSFKKAEPVSPAKNAPSDTFTLETMRVDSTQELLDQAEEAKQLPKDETKTPFGIKLRSTSHSFKFRSEAGAQRQSTMLPPDDQDDKKKSSTQMSERLLANTSCMLKSSDPAPFGIKPSLRHTTSLEESPQTTPTEVQTTSLTPREAETTPLETQPSPQAASSEVSWMSLAMEKTRSLQLLFTSRFQRDFTGTQTAAQPKSQEETMTGSQIQVQTVKIQQSTTQPSSDTLKDESVQSSSQEQAAKSSTTAKQRKMTLISQFESFSAKDSPMSRQTSQSDVQTIPKTTQSLSRLSPQTGTTSPFTRGNVSQLLGPSCLSSVQQQTSWSNRGLQPTTQLKPAPSAPESEPAVISAAAPTLNSALERREREASVPKESPSLLSKRVLWSGSVADRAVFLEKRAECSTLPLLKEVEQKKVQTQMPTSGDNTLGKLFPLSKDTVEIRQVAKSAESSPSRVLEKPREDKWTRKNVELPSSPSSLRTHSSELESDSGQPSWMELAKRKSMAWSDKSMD
ncbi:capping protein-inhibiting regulator of actin dynamics isoform X2 [Girardinichthys multiradiatus]|uniref:capping protein-inhibiting regulator of actin dynamics isoform X2 n=1 Tax=Girardinichthys multiradiatus TaxID=208333 RepID=UPI001FACC594|nr:capping protein-inhibiting regulator of actin dynamics isoform X2 [Girardinichthys multiradiatus]